MIKLVGEGDLEELKAEKKSKQKGPSKREQVRAEYQGYLQQLTPGKYLTFELDKDGRKKFPAVKNRFQTAAKALGKEICIRRQGDQVRIWSKADWEDGRSAQTHAKLLTATSDLVVTDESGTPVEAAPVSKRRRGKDAKTAAAEDGIIIATS